MSQHTQAQKEIQLDIALANPVLLANQRQKVYLRIGLTGCHLPSQKEPLAPLNVALVLDKSSSMQGQKIYQAKKAATMIVKQLRPTDMIAIVAYNHKVKILLPTTKAQDQKMIADVIQTLSSSGETALFDGIKKGATEILKYRRDRQINRMILVSDGFANVGPDSPSEIGKLGRVLGEKNIAITTIGLGLNYNEDLMTRLSQQSDGNHIFVENAADMTHIFEQEFTDLSSVVAQEVKVSLVCQGDVRFLKLLGREPKIRGERMVLVQLNQLYSEQEKYILLELEVPPIINSKIKKIADVKVVYRDLKTNSRQGFTEKVTATFTNSPQQVTKNTNATVMTAVAEQLAVEKNKLAVQVRDQGQIREAKQLLLDNATFLAEAAVKYRTQSLEKLKTLNLQDANHLDQKHWVRQRKSMRQQQFRFNNQQKY